MSIRFATQNVKDFMRTDKATDIINNSYLTIYHRTQEIHEFKDDLRLTDQHADFIERARAGQDFDHSQALYEINNEYYPVKITATDAEQDVISYEPTDPRHELPGIGSDAESPVQKRIADEIQSYAEKAHYNSTITEPPIPGSDLESTYRTLPEEEQNAIQAIGWEHQLEALKRIDDGEHPPAVLADYVEQTTLQLMNAIGQDQLMSMISSISATTESPTAAVADGGNNPPTTPPTESHSQSSASAQTPGVWSVDNSGAVSDTEPETDDADSTSEGGWP